MYLINMQFEKDRLIINSTNFVVNFNISFEKIIIMCTQIKNGNSVVIANVRPYHILLLYRNFISQIISSIAL